MTDAPESLAKVHRLPDRHRPARKPDAVATGIPAGLIEPVPIEDVYCTGMMIEDMGDLRRLVFYSEQPLYETGTRHPVVKQKVLVQAAALKAMFQAIAKFEMRDAIAKSETE
jgi:4-aminobutyrate aminotransferase-like enzyme